MKEKKDSKCFKKKPEIWMNFPNMICMQMNTYELIEKKKSMP